MLIVFYIAII